MYLYRSRVSIGLRQAAFFGGRAGVGARRMAGKQSVEQGLQGKAHLRRQYASTARRCNAAMKVLFDALGKNQALQCSAWGLY
jgi:hypothetical protein